MGLEQLAMSGVAAVGRHRRVSDALFRFTKWGNPFADERFSWPYPMYDRMRADGPIAYGRPYRQWFVFGYDEVQEVLRSPHTATAPVGELLLSTSRYRELTPAARSNFSRWLLDQRSAEPHPIACRGEPGVHTPTDRTVRAVGPAGRRRVGRSARHFPRDGRRRGIHGQAADRGDRRDPGTAARSSRLAPRAPHARSAGCWSR